MKDFILKRKKLILAFIFCGILLYLFFTTIGCPIKYVTGVCCPGCGMSRALYYLITLDFKNAFYMHPFIFLMPVCLVVFLKRNKMPKKIYNSLIIVFIVGMTGLYLYRLLSGSEIVYADIENGLIYKIIEYVKALL